ncbi:M48 family metallopeptidase [Candidatus Saccharibacteria bacterium]|nr:M48 family metallopeptidase [Candidatus Saccharibacteria bacterium]
MYTEVSKNKRNSTLLILVFLTITVIIGWVFSRALNNPTILYGAAIVSLFYTWVSYYNSDKMVLAVSGAREVQKKDAPELYRIVENLAITGGLPTPRVFIIEDTAPNAFATGRDPQHAVVCVTTGLLEKLERVELEGVIAHELSHIGNYDIRIMSLVAVLVSVIALLSDFFLRWGFWFGGDDSDSNNNSNPVFFLVAIILAIVAPIIGVIIQLAVSRKREFLADASGALLSRHPEGLAQALEKIASDKEPLEAANKATANMYIINPLRENVEGAGKKSFAAKLFSTHPDTAERIKRLREMGSKA